MMRDMCAACRFKFEKIPSCLLYSKIIVFCVCVHTWMVFIAIKITKQKNWTKTYQSMYTRFQYHALSLTLSSYQSWFEGEKSSLPPFKKTNFDRKTIHTNAHIHTISFFVVVIFEQAVGYGIIAVTFALQPLMKWACDRIKGVGRIAIVDVFLFLSFVGTANVWRGLWTILDIHFLPSK